MKELFREVPRLELARFRFLFCLSMIFSFSFNYFEAAAGSLAMSRKFSIPYRPIPLLNLMGNTELPGDLAIRLMLAFLLVSLFCAALGIFVRVALAAALVIGIFFLGFEMGSSIFSINYGAGRSKSLSLYILFLLLLSPGVAHMGPKQIISNERGGETQYWPIFLIKFSICMVFFSAAMSKLQYGLQWADGYTLQAFLLEKNSGMVSNWLSGQLWICRSLSLLVLLFEFFVPVVLFSRRLEIPFLVLALFFHLANSILLGVTGFFSSFIFGYLIFADSERIECARNFFQRLKMSLAGEK